MADTCGYKVLDASGDVGVAGMPISIFGYAVESGATAAQPYFNNGIAASQSKVFIAGPITASQSNVNSCGSIGVRFPSGCYVSFDANTTAVTVFYRQEG